MVVDGVHYPTILLFGLINRCNIGYIIPVSVCISFTRLHREAIFMSRHFLIYLQDMKYLYETDSVMNDSTLRPN